MKKFFIFTAAVISAALFAQLPEPVVHFDYTGDVIKAGGKYEAPKLPANISIAEGKQAIQFPANGAELTIPGSANISLAEGGTLYALVYFEDEGVTANKNESHDMIFFKNKDFLLGRSWGGIYFNGGDSKTYGMHVSTKTVPTKKWTAVAASVAKNPKGHRVTIYIDGKREAIKWFTFKMAAPGKTPVTIGKGWGGPWLMNGKIGRIMIFDKALTDEQIAELTAKEAYLKSK